MSPNGDYVGVAEAARLLGISPRTLHRWLRDGLLAHELSEAGEPMLRREDVMRHLDPPDEE
jgi:excisionase family DNA binding protein